MLRPMLENEDLVSIQYKSFDKMEKCPPWQQDIKIEDEYKSEDLEVE
jgi:hypothetical protein